MMTGRRQYSLIYTTLLVFIVALSISFFTIQQSLAATNDIATQLTVLKKLQDDGVINQEEFNQAKDILLNKDKAKDKSSQSEATTKTVSLTEETKPKKKKNNR